MMNTTKLKNITKCVGIGILLSDPSFAGEGYSSGSGYSGSSSYYGGSDIASRERQRRLNAIMEAEEHLKNGRAAYQRADYETAVEELRAAMTKTPRGTAAASRRKAISENLSDASIALAQKYRQIGKRQEARTLLENVLVTDPSNSAAATELDYLDDPIRTNPALDYEYTKNVDKVRRLLYLGEGYYNLGQYDKAELEFNNVLKIDKYNKAARRWLERVSAIRSDYYRAAYDHTRAKLLEEVDRAWETAVVTETLGDEVVIGGNTTTDPGDSITTKLRTIIIPKVDMVDVTIEEAIDELRLRSIELDPEIDPARKGINFIVKKGNVRRSATSSSADGDLGLESTISSSSDDPSAIRIPELKLSNLPLVKVLDAICDLSGLRYRIDEYTVTLLPAGDTDDGEVVTRTWKVTPTFLSDLGGDAGSVGTDSSSTDPFADSSEDFTESTFSKPDVKQLLERNGVTFADGTNANLLAASSTLIVRNTINNLDLVDDIVNDIIGRTPKQIRIQTKFVEINQDNADEIGFDWNVGISPIANSGITINGGTPNSSTNTEGFITNGFNRQISDGLRSGGNALTGNSIDSLINAGIASQGEAPGILSIGGILNGTTLEMVFRGLSQKRGIDLMTAPSVVARSGETAKIEVIREFIYPTEFDPPRLPQRITTSTGLFPVTPATPTAFETRNTGVSLEILPQTGDANDYVINLNIQPEVVEFEGFVNYGSPITGSVTSTDLLGNSFTEQVVITENRIELPIFSVRRVETAITIFDGYTVAVGGLIREDVQNVEDKIPILGDIPLIGRLFQSKAEQRIKSNLVVFVTAQVIDATGQPIRKNQSSVDNELDELFSDGGILPAPIQ